MTTLASVCRLVFEEMGGEGDGGDGPYYVAKTPFGYYEYSRDEDGNIEVCAQFDEGAQSGVFAKCGDAITAQRLCNGDFASRIRMSIQIGEQE